MFLGWGSQPPQIELRVRVANYRTHQDAIFRPEHRAEIFNSWDYLQLEESLWFLLELDLP